MNTSLIKLRTLALIPTLFLLQTVMGFAAAGDLDTSFAGTGMLRVGFGHSPDNGRAVALTADGRILMAGNSDSQTAILARFNTNNVLDTSFGDNGHVEIPLPNSGTIVTMAIQQDGKIVLGGNVYTGTAGNYDYLIIRCNADGTLDTSFGDGDGIVTTEFQGYQDECNSVTIQPDGKIVAAGKETVPGQVVSSYHLSMTRYNTDGSIDTSFGSSGRVIQTLTSGYNTWANAVIQEGDGNLLVAGFANQFAVFRYTTNGALDGTFGSGGIVTCPGYQAQAITIQPAGIIIGDPAMIVAAGKDNVQSRAIVARMNFSGALDSNLNGTGSVSIPALANSDVTGVAAFNPFRSAKKILIAGYLFTGAGRDFFTAKFNYDGTLDSTFGSGGIAKTDLGGDDYAYGMILQPGTKILLAGTTSTDFYNPDLALVRYNYTDGSLDTTFNGTGILIQNLGDRQAEALGTAIQADGKIVVAGRCYLGFDNAVAICRLNPSGDLDTSFGAAGKVISQLGDESSEADAVAIQADGKIIIAGSAYNGADLQSFMVARFLTTGALDPSFGTNGVVITPLGTNSSFASAIALQSDGKILVGGQARPGSDEDFAVLRYTTNGTLDTTWNGTGEVLTGIGPSDDTLYSLKVQSDGKVIAAGGSYFPPIQKFAMARYTSSGALDSSFGSFGRVATEFGSGTLDVATCMALQPDGKIVLAGVDAPSSLSDLDVAVARYTTSGALDSTFDGDGKNTTAIGLAYDAGYAVAIQSDNRILVGARTQMGSHYKFGAARFLSSGALDPDYGSGGVTFFDFGTSADENLDAMALDSAGRAVMVGEAGNIFGIIRVLNANPAIQITSIQRLPNGHILLSGIGVPNASHTLQQSPKLGPANFTPMAPPVTADSSGHWQFEDASASTSGNRFYRLSFP